MRMLFVVPMLGFMSFSLAAFVPQSADTSQHGLAYGHLDLDAPIERVELARVSGIRGAAARVLPNGDFYVADLEPGTYVVSQVRVGGVWRHLASDRGIHELTVRVEAGAINYAGAWSLHRAGTAYQAVPADRPGSDVLLKRMRFAMRGTGWEKRIP